MTVYGLPPVPTAPIGVVSVRQSAASWSASLVATLGSRPTGFLLGGMSADSGAISAVSSAGYSWQRLLDAGTIDCCSLWLGTPVAVPGGAAVTYTGGGGAYYNPQVAELLTTMRSIHVFDTGVTTLGSAATSITTPALTPQYPKLFAVAFSTANSGGNGINGTVGGGAWQLLASPTLFAMAIVPVLRGKPISATFTKTGAEFRNAGIVLIGDPRMQNAGMYR